MRKLSNEIIDNRLENRNIKRLDNFIDVSTSINFQCLKSNCNYIWITTPNSVLNSNTGCPKCSNNIPINDNIIDERIKNKFIKRLEPSISGSHKIKFQCIRNNCNYIWITSPHNIFSSKMWRFYAINK